MCGEGGTHGEVGMHDEGVSRRGCERKRNKGSAKKEEEKRKMYQVAVANKFNMCPFQEGKEEGLRLKDIYWGVHTHPLGYCGL